MLVNGMLSLMGRWVLFLLAPLIVVSCATVVAFDVQHPPLVDLRDANTITVIPFEWTSAREHYYFANRVTAALINGLRWGNIEFIDPYALGNTSGRSYRQFADVYISGRIINVNAYDYVEIVNDGNQTLIREIVTRTADVDIEYSYIRSVDNKTLGYFKKRETSNSTFERTRNQEQENINRDINRNIDRGAARRGAGRGAGVSRGAFLQRETWQTEMAASAIVRFADTMVRELGPWTATESRKLRKGDSPLDEGYNAAILLAADAQFSAALELLERLRDGLLKEGKKIPSFIKNEITKMTEYVNGFKILGTIFPASTATAAPAAAIAAASAEEITGTVNIPHGIIYALNGPVSSVNDNSIFPKMVASANVVGGQWSMRLPNAAPAEVWLLATDGRSAHYITRTAVKFSGAIALDTAVMTKLN